MLSFSCALWLAAASLVIAERRMACEHSFAYLKCGRGQVIHIHSADYGRSDHTTCSRGRPSKQLQNVHCASSTASHLVAVMCNGKMLCSVRASHSVFGDPCVGTYKYLQVSYSCKRSPSVRKVSCEGHTAALSCDPGMVIRIHRADYGRRNRTTCSQGRPSRQLQNVNCASSATTRLVSQMCDGKSHCSVTASNSVFGDPCVGTYKYLQVFYSCKSSSFVFKEICEGQTATLSCDSGKVIRIDSADYGRWGRIACSHGRPSQQLQDVNCASSTANDLVAKMCNGRSGCTVQVVNSVFGDPCRGTYKYLQLKFSCIRASV